MPKAVLIEIDGSHDECLYSQLLFLKTGGYDVSLICSENLRRQVKDFDPEIPQLFFSFDGRSELHKISALRAIRRYIIDSAVTTVILNSTHGHLIRNFTLLPFPSGIRFFGTLHGINKLQGSFTQNVISRRIRNYFLLNDYLKQNLTHVPHKGLNLESYYPIFFPDFPNSPAIYKPAKELWIAIPGQVEYKRRDYETLVRAFAALKTKPDYKFLLLGKSDHKEGNGPELRRLVDDLGVASHFHFHKGFMENAEFHAYLRMADVIMPLIHPGNDGFEKYLVYQISGSYNLAFAYKKPLLMLSDFSRYEDFRENAVFYERETLPEILEELGHKLEMLNPDMYKQPKWSYEYQAARYLTFLGDHWQ